MKRVNWIFMTAICLLSVMALSFSGCSDDDEVSMSNSDLVGTWQLVRYHYQWKENGKVVEEGDEEDDSVMLRFEEDKTCYSAEHYNGKWNWSHKGSWNYKGGKIEVFANGESEFATVKTLTSSKLIIESVDKYTEDGISYEDYALEEYRKVND